MPLHLHPDSLSPDPLSGRNVQPGADGWMRFELRPVARIDGEVQTVWQRLDREAPWSPLTLCPDSHRHAEVLVDFGTELEAELEIAVETPGPLNVYLTQGESEPEARGWGGYGQGRWCQVRAWHAPAAGRHVHRLQANGFRYVRLQFHDVEPGVRLVDCTAHATAVGGHQRGDFRCPDDPALQRLWHTCLYTARLCTRPDAIWDGPKRDRHGWYGDARVCQLAFAEGFLEPAPARAMLARLPDSEWVNGIPNFSFDGVVMLHDLLLAHGLDVPGRNELVARADALLEWAARTQSTPEGLLRRTETKLFFDHGFIDWSAMPVGGRLDELFPVQARHVEALRAQAAVHDWLGNAARSGELRARASAIAAVLVNRFACPGGFHHTLRRVRPGFEKYGPGWGEPSYAPDGPNFGPSGPSRHASAWAVWAGLVDETRRMEVLERGFAATGQPPVITPMFHYYEQEARARLGAPAAALFALREALAAQVMPHDSACIWESFEPEVADFRKWGLHGWPKSLCHGWGAGLVPFVRRWLLGLENLAPGGSRLRLHAPAARLRFRAQVPTAHGDVHLERRTADGPVEWEAPAGVVIEESDAGAP